MVWGGEDVPCAIVSLMSIGKLGLKENKEHSKVLSQHFEKNLGISPDHAYISFQDAKTQDLGYNGTTFHDILG